MHFESPRTKRCSCSRRSSSPSRRTSPEAALEFAHLQGLLQDPEAPDWAAIEHAILQNILLRRQRSEVSRAEFSYRERSSNGTDMPVWVEHLSYMIETPFFHEHFRGLL